ncbi:MAG TPA: TonB family protein [Telmatospirillum sp.]|nr:TonB family protein [Telmatospirillum sp.]
MTISVPCLELTTVGRSQHHATPWRQRWPFPLSLLLHMVVGAIFLFGITPSPPPPPLPQIDLLPPAPLPPLPEEAAPSPTKATLKPVPAFPKAVEPPPAPPPLRPIDTVHEKADAAPPKPPNKKPPAKADIPTVQPRPPDPKATPSVEAATPVNGAKADADTVLSDHSPNTRPSGPPPDYIGLIRARLEKVKRYPAAARAAGQEGTVHLSFVLDKTGDVVSWKISRGSGCEPLDDEVGAMIQRASFPPFPASLDQDRLRLLVPVEFSLKSP